MKICLLIICLGLTNMVGAQSLEGIFDIHAHADPDQTDRSIDVLELAKMYEDRGFRGFVIMNHHDPTAGLAYLARKHAPKLEVFGGIVCNHMVGGMNKHAVLNFIRNEGGLGKIVYMPTTGSEYDAKNSNNPDRPYVSVSKDGELLPEVLEMLDLIAEHKLILSTGHSSPEESLLLIREGRKRGIEKIFATNPTIQHMNIEQMQEAAEMGAMIEFIYYSASPSRRGGPPHTIAEYAEQIKAVGPEHCILSSCGGQGWMPIHTSAWIEYFSLLREQGLTVEELELMSKTNPARLMGIE